MPRHSYHERDYPFGQAMLTLRTSIGLTQVSLAHLLGVSRRAVSEWEGGSSYPKADHLQHMLELCVQQQVFEPGREEEKIRTLWKTAHQRVLIDEVWLAGILARPSAPPASAEEAGEAAEVRATPALVQLSPEVQAPAAHEGEDASPRVDWVGALDVSRFTGREVEVAQLSQWIAQERCRLVALLGTGGIGKSALASLIGSRLTSHFEAVLWRSVRDAPSCEDLVTDCIIFFSETPPASFPSSLEQRINQLVARLQANRNLLVLDNLETLLASGDPEGGYLPGYEGYGRLIERVAESAHQSCVLLTSREKPRAIEPLEGERSPVRSLRLEGMDAQAARDLLSDRGLNGTPAAWQWLVASYAGNPLVLKIMGQVICDLFNSDIDRFLHEGELIFNGVRPVLRQQVGRLTPLEHLLLMWLAVLREWTDLPTLLLALHPREPRARVLEALEGLGRRSLIERGQQTSFSLQSVVMEYLTDELGERLAEEIVLGDPQQMRRVALEKAQAKDYVRETQVRLLVHPLIERLRSKLGADVLVEAHLLRLLSQFRTEDQATQGYGPTNVIILLKALRGHLRGQDFSRLALRGVFLQGIDMQDTTLSNSTLQDCVFTQRLDDVLRVVISSNGAYWAASSGQGEIRVWDGGGWFLLHTWHAAHTDMIWHLTFSPDERTLASGSSNGSIKLWDVVSGGLLWMNWLTKSTTWLAFSPDGGQLASGGLDAVVRLWDAQQGTPLGTLPHTSAVFSLVWAPDQQRLISGCADGSIWIWKPEEPGSSTCVRVLAGHKHWVTGLAFSPDGTQFASASYDGTIKLWDMTNGNCLQTFSEHTARVMRVSWSPDGRTLASCSFDRTIRFWDLKEGRSRMVLQGHTETISNLAFTPDSRTLLSSSFDGTLRVWDVENGQCLRIIGGYMVSLVDLDWSPDSTLLASCGTDRLVRLWDATSGALFKVLRGHHDWVRGVAWSPDGQILASGGHDSIRLWDPSASVCLRMLQNPDAPSTPLESIAWSPDGNLLACGSYLQGVLVWEMPAGSLCWIGQTQPTRIRRIAWSPDGTRLAAGGDDGSVYVWDAKDGTPLQRLEGHEGVVRSIAWSPDGMLLASVGSGRGNGEIFIWEAQSGQRVLSLSEHAGGAFAVAWSSHGEMLISGGSDGMLRWWQVQSGACMRVQEAHQGAMQALKVSPDGSRLASCGDDGAIVLWDLERGERLQMLRQDRPYERLNITGMQGLTEAQKASLRTLGAFEETAGEQAKEIDAPLAQL